MKLFFIRTDLHPTISLDEDRTAYKVPPSIHLNLYGNGTGDFENTGYLSTFELISSNSDIKKDTLKGKANWSSEYSESENEALDKKYPGFHIGIPKAIHKIFDFAEPMGNPNFHFICLEVENEEASLEITKVGAGVHIDDGKAYFQEGNGDIQANRTPPFYKNKAQIFTTKNVNPYLGKGSVDVSESLLGGGWHRFASIITLTRKETAQFLLGNIYQFATPPNGGEVWECLVKTGYQPKPIETFSSKKQAKLLEEHRTDSSSKMLSGLKRTLSDSTTPSTSQPKKIKYYLDVTSELGKLHKQHLQFKKNFPEQDFSAEIESIHDKMRNNAKYGEIFDEIAQVRGKFYEHMISIFEDICTKCSNYGHLFDKQIEALAVILDPRYELDYETFKKGLEDLEQQIQKSAPIEAVSTSSPTFGC